MLLSLATGQHGESKPDLLQGGINILLCPSSKVKRLFEGGFSMDMHVKSVLKEQILKMLETAEEETLRCVYIFLLHAA